jgi:hypothetical protein
MTTGFDKRLRRNRSGHAGQYTRLVIRTALAAVLLVLLLPAIVVTNASSWVARTVLDEQAFSVAVGRAIDTPTLRAALADRLTDEIAAYLSANPAILHILASEILHVDGPATRDEVRTALRPAVAAALDDPAVRRARDEAIADVHASLIGTASRRDPVVRIEGDTLVLDTERLIGRLAVAVDPRLTPEMIQLPDPDRIVVLARADGLSRVRDAVSFLAVIQPFIPIVAIVAALAIVALAHRRVRALGLVGLVVILAGIVTLVAAWVGGDAIGGASSDGTVRAITSEVYGTFLGLLAWQTAVLMIGGLVTAMVVWLNLRGRRAARTATTSRGRAPAS